LYHEQYLIHPVAVHIDDLKSVLVPVEVVSCDGYAPKIGHNEPPQCVIIFISVAGYVCDVEALLGPNPGTALIRA
jgi:hypothetical protein